MSIKVTQTWMKENKYWSPKAAWMMPLAIEIWLALANRLRATNKKEYFF